MSRLLIIIVTLLRRASLLLIRWRAMLRRDIATLTFVTPCFFFFFAAYFFLTLLFYATADCVATRARLLSAIVVNMLPC